MTQQYVYPNFELPCHQTSKLFQPWQYCEQHLFSQLPATRSPASTLNSFLCRTDPFILTHHTAENLSLFPSPVPQLILSKSTAVHPYAMTAYQEEDVQHH